MDATANVRAIEALSALRERLNQFKSNAQACVQAATRELVQAHEQMRLVCLQTQKRVEICAVRYMEAQRALQSCLSSSSEDGPPNCGVQELEFLAARQALAVAERELQEAKGWMKNLESERDQFQSQARQYASLLDHDVPRATAFLDTAVTTLTAYVADLPASTVPLSSVAIPSASAMAFAPGAHLESETSKERESALESLAGSDRARIYETGPEGRGGVEGAW